MGELKDSAFAEQQWLLQRDGRFIQVTELLYRITEQADGECTLDQIAAAVSDSTRWLLTPDQAAHLIRTKLIPLGVIRAADGSVAPPRKPAGLEGLSSPLSLHLRARMIGPRAIEVLTRPLRYLFHPLVVISILSLGGFALFWLYFVHGFMGAVLDALYTPGAVLIVLTLLLVAAVFHEFGHAAALRYGGGRARGIGVGFYLIFPAFYTDVTDSYRLGRWARVRTGLGGVYFHLIFALAVIGVALWLEREFLLLAVPLINLEILRQFIPAVRLDGYWVLADLAGVPDFFSQAMPFARSVGRKEILQGERLPTLNRWPRSVFVVYLLATVPALAFVAVLFLTQAPRLLIGFCQGLMEQATLFGQGRAQGDYIVMATVALEMFVLTLPVVGIFYLLHLFTWKPLRAAWRQPDPRRRIGGVAALAALFVPIGLLWTHQLQAARGRADVAGVLHYTVNSRRHVVGPVSYPQTPPVGGDHSPLWQNCGFYDQPVANENAVHSLEHGAVWITYRPGIPRRDLAALRRLARESYVLVSPYPGLEKPVVASAWGWQLRLGSAKDSRLRPFISHFRAAQSTPESGRPCEGGTGKPLR